MHANLWRRTLVHDYSTDGSELSISGIAIVNGAQTTGALGRVSADDLDGVSVLARFVKTNDRQVIDDIIRFNNSQNPIQPSDFRSRDPQQERLRAEFEKMPDVLYLGARRGGQSDPAKKPSHYMSSDTAAQALAAFHGDPSTAYHELRSIWERDEIYSRYFNDQTTAPHIVFAFSLVRAIQEYKARLVATSSELTEADLRVLTFLRKRGSTLLLGAAISACIDTVLDRPIASRFRLSFGPTVSPGTAAEIWQPLVEALGAFSNELDVPDSATALRSGDRPAERIARFQQHVSAVKVPLASTFDAFAMHVCED